MWSFNNELLNHLRPADCLAKKKTRFFSVKNHDQFSERQRLLDESLHEYFDNDDARKSFLSDMFRRRGDGLFRTFDTIIRYAKIHPIRWQNGQQIVDLASAYECNLKSYKKADFDFFNRDDRINWGNANITTHGVVNACRFVHMFRLEQLVDAHGHAMRSTDLHISASPVHANVLTFEVKTQVPKINHNP